MKSMKISGKDEVVPTPTSISTTRPPSKMDSDSDDPDIPKDLLNGVVVYQEVRNTVGGLASPGVASELRKYGAEVKKTFSNKVTHCIFYNGTMSTYCKAKDKKVPLVSPLWIETCKKKRMIAPAKGLEPRNLNKYEEKELLFRLTHKTRGSCNDSKKRRELESPFAANKTPVGSTPLEKEHRIIDTPTVAVNTDKSSKKTQRRNSAIKRIQMWEGNSFVNEDSDEKQVASLVCSTPSRSLPGRQCKKRHLEFSDDENDSLDSPKMLQKSKFKQTKQRAKRSHSQEMDPTYKSNRQKTEGKLTILPVVKQNSNEQQLVDTPTTNTRAKLQPSRLTLSEQAVKATESHGVY